jgi:hypothetical protein
MKGTLRYPGFRAQWKSARRNHGIEFVEFMDKLLAETPVAPRFDILSRWGASYSRRESNGATLASPHIYTIFPSRQSWQEFQNASLPECPLLALSGHLDLRRTCLL